ncbi:hypothetical protein [Daejeonella oryzae]|uniref:hypothetical protein n=1 Tax=Daejeonella oryzae TaxID=1122943 RepID=UPI0003F66EC0|nr:hypothetical protein [Daejeonella oryzae]
MAVNLDKMIAAFKEFIDPTNTLNFPDDAYKGLMLQGLEASTYYSKHLNSTETKTL